MPNGVICGGAVDGSNQLGAMVTCQAMMASPVGVVWAAAPCAWARLGPVMSSETMRTKSGNRMSRRRGPMFVT